MDRSLAGAVRSLAAPLALALLAVAPACGGGSAASSAPAGLTAVAAPLPAGVRATNGVELNDATCASGGNCVVTGEVFTRKPLGALGFLLVQTAGKWRVVTVALPHDLSPGPKQVADIVSVSCPAVGRCVGVGSAHSGKSADAILMTQQGTHWLETALRLPAGAQLGGPSAISCATVGNCSVVGGVSDFEGNDQSILYLDEKDGRWGSWREVALPPEDVPVQPVGADSISCQAAGECTATGSYENQALENVGLLLTERAGGWGPGAQPALPADENFGSNPLIGLSSLSCPSPGDCTVVGGYFDNARNQQGLILNEHDGKWLRGLEAPLPPDAGPNPQHGDGAEMPLKSVSCPAAEACAAVGFYRDQGDNLHTLLLSETAGKWSASEPRYPADAAGGADAGGLGSIVCTSPRNCVAAGGYVTGTNPDGNYKGKPLLVYERRGIWQHGLTVELPEDAADASGSGLTSVTCPPAGPCLAVGSYVDASGGEQGLLVTLPRP
jgi:hypothetical protein